ANSSPRAGSSSRSCISASIRASAELRFRQTRSRPRKRCSRNSTVGLTPRDRPDRSKHPTLRRPRPQTARLSRLKVLLRFPQALRFLVDDETIEAVDKLITLGQVPPSSGDIEEVLSQLGVSRFACAPFRFGRARDAVGDVIAQLVQHGARLTLRRTDFIG